MTSSTLILVADVDSTLVREEVIDLLAARAGSSASVSAITARAMAGEIDFAESLAERVATLRGLPAQTLDEIAGRLTPTQGVHAVVSRVHALGGIVGAVSGGFQQVLDLCLPALGIDVWKGNVLEVENGRLTGRIVGPVVDAAAKAHALDAWALAAGVPDHRRIAVGDGANDVRMMASASLSVAFRGKPAVRRAADVCVDRPDLSELLPLFGG